MNRYLWIGCVFLLVVGLEVPDIVQEYNASQMIASSLGCRFREIESELNARHIKISADYEDETRVTLFRSRGRLNLLRIIQGVDMLCWFVALDEEGFIRGIVCYDYPKFSRQIYGAGDLSQSSRSQPEQERFRANDNGGDEDGEDWDYEGYCRNRQASLSEVVVKARSYIDWPVYKIMLDIRRRGCIALKGRGFEMFGIMFPQVNDYRFKQKVSIDVPQLSIIDAIRFIADQYGLKVIVSAEGDVSVL